MDAAKADFPVGKICEWASVGFELSIVQRGEVETALVLRVAPPGDENEGVKFGGESVRVAISDGSETWYEKLPMVRAIRAVPAVAARLFSHATTSPSPRCDAASPDRWGWFTPEGLGTTAWWEVSVPRSAVPHLVGRRGETVRTVENALGVLIGIIDGTDDQATVTLIGPLAQVVLAKEVVTALAVGARSILSRLIKPD